LPAGNWGDRLGTNEVEILQVDIHKELTYWKLMIDGSFELMGG
jgi:hypothetical protein